MRPLSPAVSAAGLVKSYPGGRGKPAVHALDGLDLEIAAGSVYALLGPNGAGKSTTVRILATLSRADSGTAAVAGIDVGRHPDRARRALGLVGQRASSDPMATTRENLVLAGRLQGMPRAAAATGRARELVARFGLEDQADRLAKTLSGGTARRLDVAIGLMHRPLVLFLDEPTTGLDPEARAAMWSEIARLGREEGTTVLLTTHYLEEADRLAARLAIVDAGKVVAEGTPEALKRELHGDTVAVELETAEAAAAATAVIAHVGGVGSIAAEGVTLRARAESGARAVPAVVGALEDAGISVASVTVARPSLDDVYLRHAGRAFAVAA